MVDQFDREKLIDCMFDPVTSSVLAELEHGPKECSILTEKFSISENEVLERLSYLLEHDFVQKTSKNGKLVFTANTAKLNQVVENSENFDTTIAGLETLDSYLN